LDLEHLKHPDSEAAIIASLIHHPEFYYYSEDLLPEHFTRRDNNIVYRALTIIAENGVEHVDAFNILAALGSTEKTRPFVDDLDLDLLNEMVDDSADMARHSVEEYQICVRNVMDGAFRRDAIARLNRCIDFCMNDTEEDIQQKIYDAIDQVMAEYSYANEVPLFSDIVDKCWNEIKSRQGDGYAGIPFKFPALNEYATIEKGELFIFAAEAKQGKSMMLLNCAVDLLKRDMAVLYIDSELNSRLFTARILAHLTGIEYKRLTSGNYSGDEAKRIEEELEWIKSKKFVHIYLPMFDKQTIYTAVKKIKHTMGLDVLIIDYFKSSGDGDAFNTYQELGSFVDMVKNKICGDMEVCGIGAAQATITGKVADSAKIGRNASTIALITDKSPEEIEIDGTECGNKKLRVVLNRNGMQMAPGEYIDLFFDGNHILYSEAKQHIPQTPF